MAHKINWIRLTRELVPPRVVLLEVSLDVDAPRPYDNRIMRLPGSIFSNPLVPLRLELLQALRARMPALRQEARQRAAARVRAPRIRVYGFIPEGQEVVYRGDFEGSFTD